MEWALSANSEALPSVECEVERGDAPDASSRLVSFYQKTL